MIEYSFKFTKIAQKFIQKQSKTIRAQLKAAIYNLPAGDTKEVKAHKGFYRLRVGTYRIIYTIDNKEYIILIVDAGNRGQIYKRY